MLLVQGTQMFFSLGWGTESTNRKFRWNQQSVLPYSKAVLVSGGIFAAGLQIPLNYPLAKAFFGHV